MNILVFTRGAWDNSNSIGNTMSNLFNGYDKDKIANIYLRSARPYNDVCEKYFSISDFEIIKNFFKTKHCVGKYFEYRKIENTQNVKFSEESTYTYFRNKKSILAYEIQEFLWSLNTWKNPNLDQFLADFKPDVVFSPCFQISYAHKVLEYIQKKTNAKIVLFHADDYLTNNSFTGNFFEKNYKKRKANIIKRSVQKTSLNYCISHLQQKEYALILKREMKILFKGADFSMSKPKLIERDDNIIRMVYIGSTLYGRWQTLSLLAKAMSDINSEKKTFELHIYSQYQPTDEALHAMQITGTSSFMGSLPAIDVANKMADADIVLHVESFDKEERLKTRLSFSTKIVDCLHSGRCIMAIGGEEAASIDYLVKNDAAIVAFDEMTINEKLKQIAKNRDLIEEYSEKAWDCGVRNHQIHDIQSKLFEDLARIAAK